MLFSFNEREHRVKIFLIAQNTFRETARDRILRFIVLLSLLIILASQAIAEIALGDRTKVISDISLGAMDFFGIVLTLLMTTGLLYKEIQKKTLFTVLSHPVSRTEYLLGKYIGIATTLLVCFCLMAILLGIFLYWNGRNPSWMMINACFFLLLGLLLLTAIGFFFSTILTPLSSALATLLIFIAGRTSYEIKYWSESFTGLGKYFLETMYYLLPNFMYFNIKMAAVHEEWKAITNREASPDMFFYAILYFLAYTSFMLYASILVFRKKNL